jgi:hypothetical protein
VAKHALPNARNGCRITGIGRDVAVNTFQVNFIDVGGVGEQNRLFGADARQGQKDKQK